MFSFFLTRSLCTVNCSNDQEYQFAGAYSTITLSNSEYICLRGAQYVLFNEEMTLYYNLDLNESSVTKDITKQEFNNSFILAVSDTSLGALFCNKTNNCTFTTLNIPTPLLSKSYIATYTGEDGFVLSTQGQLPSALSIVAPFNEADISTSNCYIDINAILYTTDGSETAISQIGQDDKKQYKDGYNAATFIPQQDLNNGPSQAQTMKITIQKSDESSVNHFTPRFIPQEVGVYGLAKLKEPEETAELIEESCEPETSPYIFYKQISESYFGECDNFILKPEKYSKASIESGKKYCTYGGMVIGTKNKISADIRANTDPREADIGYDLSENELLSFSETATKYENPVVIKPRDQIVALTCDDKTTCTLEIAPINKIQGDVYLLLNKYGDIKISSTSQVNFRFYQPQMSLIKFKRSEDTSVSSDEGYIADSELKSKDALYYITGDVNITASASASLRKLLAATEIPEIVGKIPSEGIAYTAAEINKEYENPGSFDPAHAQIKDTFYNPGKKIGITVGIILGVMVLIGIAIGCVYFFYCKPKNDAAGASDHISDNL